MGRFFLISFRKTFKTNKTNMKRNIFFNLVVGGFIGLTTSFYGYKITNWQFWLILTGGIIVLDIVYNLIQKD